MTFSTLKDVIDSIAKSLHLSTSFPSLLYIFINAFFIIPHYFNIKLDSSEHIILLTSLALIISFSLYAFNSPLIRLFEGYIFRYEPFFLKNQRRYQDIFSLKKSEINKIQKEIKEIKEIKENDYNNEKLMNLIFIGANLEMEISDNYPPEVQQILPTKVGNIIAAFENYPKIRYGIDTIALWSRFVPILKENNYLEFVSHEKTTFDFHMNMCIIFSLLGIEFIYLNLYYGKFLSVIITLICITMIIYILYEGMAISAKYWGETICAAFDLYRYDLYQRLGLKEAKDFQEEYNRWEKISQFILYRRKDLSFNDFLSQSEFINRNVQKKG